MKTVYKTLLALSIFGVVLSGCTATKNLFGKWNNGSLDYQQSKKLDPIELPTTQPKVDFTPLYPTPKVGDNTLNLSNESGSQYELPKPPQAR